MPTATPCPLPPRPRTLTPTREAELEGTLRRAQVGGGRPTKLSERSVSRPSARSTYQAASQLDKLEAEGLGELGDVRDA